MLGTVLGHIRRLLCILVNNYCLFGLVLLVLDLLSATRKGLSSAYYC